VCESLSVPVPQYVYLVWSFEWSVVLNDFVATREKL